MVGYIVEYIVLPFMNFILSSDPLMTVLSPELDVCKSPPVIVTPLIFPAVIFPMFAVIAESCPTTACITDRLIDDIFSAVTAPASIFVAVIAPAAIVPAVTAPVAILGVSIAPSAIFVLVIAPAAMTAP